jgi:hypothetical protein
MSGSHTVNGGIVTTGASAGYSINRRDTSAYAGGWYAPSTSILLDVSGLGTALAISSSGNVGIGTTTPNGGLTVVAPSTSTAISLWGRSSDNYSALRFQSNTGATTYATIYSNSSDLIFENSGSSRILINASGNVGIGTSTPTGNFRLEVSSSFDGVSVISSQSSQTLRLSSATNNNTILRINNFNGNFYDIQNQPADNSLVIDYNDTERLRIKSTGVLDQNGLGRICFRGNIAGNQSVTVTVNCVSESSFKVTCMMNHYGLFNSYGCAKMSFYANGPSSDESVISNVTSGNGGSWSIARVSNTSFSITKNAGSYAGPGEYFIEVIGATLT